MRNSLVAVALANLLLIGCSALKPFPKSPSVASRCDEAVSQGLAYGRGAALAVAEAGIAHQIDDIRGYLLSEGFHRVRPAGGSRTCQPWELGGGLTQCVVIKRFCGH
jgi:hypothetical protein